MSTQQLKLAQEEECDEKQEWWYANGGTMTFITATEAEIEEIDADEYGALYSFNDERKVEEEEFNGCCADCDDEEKKECRDCKIEAKKHCELCCGYECEDEEDEEDRCGCGHCGK